MEDKILKEMATLATLEDGYGFDEKMNCDEVFARYYSEVE